MRCLHRSHGQCPRDTVETTIPFVAPKIPETSIPAPSTTFPHLFRNARRRDRAVASREPTCTATERFYHLEELKQRMLRFLKPACLARFMRVERAGMMDVARVLYRHLPYVQTLKPLSEDPVRQQIYASAVVRIDASDISLEHVHTLLTLDPLTPPSWTKEYHPELLDVIIPPLRAQFDRLRRVSFGKSRAPFGHPTWSVHFESARAAGNAEAPAVVEYIGTLRLDESADPLRAFSAPVEATTTWPVKYRFDLDIARYGQNEKAAEDWRYALRSNQSFGQVYQSVHLGRLPAHLNDITWLYRHQTVHRYPLMDRIRTIIARSLLPFTIGNFSNFARVASCDLTCLRLAAAYPPTGAKLSFADLPTLTSVIRDHLVNLTELTIAFSGIHMAESACKYLLRPDILSGGGSIKKLVVHTDSETYRGPLFNVLRSLAPLLARLRASVNVVHPEVAIWGEPEQTALLASLRDQTAERRRHLSTVDFSTLEVVEPRSIYDLTYRDDGSPMRRSETKAAQWADAADKLRCAALSRILPGIELAACSLVDTADVVQAISGSATRPEMIQEMFKLLDAAIETRSKADEMARLAKATEDDIGAFVNSILTMAE